jgi:hypothetical protein
VGAHWEVKFSSNTTRDRLYYIRKVYTISSDNSIAIAIEIATATAQLIAIVNCWC